MKQGTTTHSRQFRYIRAQPRRLKKAVLEELTSNKERNVKQLTESAKSKNAGGLCFNSSAVGRVSVGEVDGWRLAAIGE